MEDKLKALRKKAVGLPISPGVYIMKDKKSEVIYVGKAKVLKNRVSQYFGSQSKHPQKVKRMVEQVDDFDYIITDSEFEALILECSMIKQYKPKYNILLKDDKGYSYIKITNEQWPRITEEKQKLNDDATYIGPFTSSWVVKESVNEAKKIFKIPNCNKIFSKNMSKSKPCLNYYINRCSAPCAGKINQNEYEQSIKNAVDFLTGKDNMTIKNLTEQMNKSADMLDFESAAKLRDMISAIKKLREKQKVVESKIEKQDIIALVEGENLSCFEVFRFSNSRLVDKEDFLITDIGEQSSAISEFLQQYYSMRGNIPPFVYVNLMPDEADLLEEWLSNKSKQRVKIIEPKRGDQLKLLNLCKKNATERLAQLINRTWKDSTALKELQEVLKLDKIPHVIESYDISNLAGGENVGAMVVFEDARPLKSSYRKFEIKTVIGQDDYASMREVISRRLNEYEELKGKDKGFGRLPDLILLDGGRGHVATVRPILEERGFNIPVYGMVKDSKHKTRAIAEDGGEISIDKRRQVFTLLTKIQDEVHKFAIGYHRVKRRKRTLKLELMDIPGIGEKRAMELLKHFKTLEAVKTASLEELLTVNGINKFVAEIIYRYFNDEKV